jgi:hypothetical protein
MWTLKGLIEHCNQVSSEINGKWVPSRSINYTCRTLREKLREAWAVFKGKADCFYWPENQ